MAANTNGFNSMPLEIERRGLVNEWMTPVKHADMITSTYPT